MPMLSGSNLKSVYASVKRVYYQKVGRKFKFKKGEKKKVKDTFTHLREALGDKKNQDFDTVYKYFNLYLQKQTESWLGWNRASRGNYLGFICRPDDIYTFVASKKNENKTDSDIAGTESEEDWEF